MEVKSHPYRVHKSLSYILLDLRKSAGYLNENREFVPAMTFILNNLFDV